MISRDQIKDRLAGDGVLDFLARLGMSPVHEGREIKIACPWCDGSLKIFPRDGAWMCVCFACQNGGDMFTLAGKLAPAEQGGSPSDREAFPRICQWMGGVLGIVDAGPEDPAVVAARRAKDAQRRKRALAIEENRRAKAIEDAWSVWDQAAAYDVAPAQAYLRARGVRVEALLEEGGGYGWPASIRFTPRCYRKFYSEPPHGPRMEVIDGKEVKIAEEEHVAAVLGGADVITWNDEVGEGGGWKTKLTLVQRIYVGPDGGGKIGYGTDSQGDPLTKQTLGSVSAPVVDTPWVTDLGGASVLMVPRRSDPPTAGVLVLCEGIETAAALQASVGRDAHVRACVSTAGLRAFRLHPAMVHVDLLRSWLATPGGGGDEATELLRQRCQGMLVGGRHRGWVKRIIVAGDLDMHHSRPGQNAARACASNQLVAWGVHGLEVSVALPSADVAPHLVTAAGKLVEAA